MELDKLVKLLQPKVSKKGIVVSVNTASNTVQVSSDKGLVEFPNTGNFKSGQVVNIKQGNLYPVDGSAGLVFEV